MVQLQFTKLLWCPLQVGKITAVRGGGRGAGFLMVKLVSHHNIGLAISIAAISALPIWFLDLALF